MAGGNLVALLLSVFLWLVRGKFDEIVSKALAINPHLDSTRCTESLRNSSLHLKCKYHDSHGPVGCPNTTPGPETAWVVSCLAQLLISKGFQVPVYVISGPFPLRKERIEKMLAAGHFAHVKYRSDYVIGEMNMTEINAYIHPTKSRGEGASDADIEMCVDMIDVSIHNRRKAQSECESRGIKFNEREISISMKHIAIHRDLNGCDMDKDPGSNCFSNATTPNLRYALVLEDDQLMPTNMLRLIAELILGGPSKPPGLYFMDDSYNLGPRGKPPNHLLNHSPYTNSFERSESRTCGAYMLSQEALHTMFRNGHWIPQRRPIDHNFNYVIAKDHILTHWLYPPATCHSSQGLEQLLPEGRTGCDYCCERFYKLADMTPKMVKMMMFNDESQEVPVDRL